jgi:nicotinamidase-related amidase
MYSRIDPDKPLAADAVILCIDMINDFLLEGEPFAIDEGRDMYDKLGQVLTVARDLKIPIVHGISTDMRRTLLERWAPIRDGVSLNSNTPGVAIVDELKPTEWNEYEIYLPKPKYSCFYGTALDVYLRNPPCLGRNTIIVTGMATNYCCMTTSIDAFNRDYDVIFVDDLNCTMSSNDGTDAATMHRITVETLKDGFISELLTADELLARFGVGAEKRSAA